MAKPTQWSTAWITGASSGIGRALALKLARRGVRVAASARHEEKLSEVEKLALGILPFPVDVTDRASMAATAQRILDKLGPIDLAILNAGIWEPMPASRYDAEKVARSVSVNYLGIANALEVLVPAMVARGGGHIAMVASVAGYRGMPGTLAYGPTKAAIINLAEGLRADLQRKGVCVSVINPGYVETPMTAVNEFPMPFIISAEIAADRIITGLERRKFEIAFPWQTVALLKFARLLPYPFYFWLNRTFLEPPRR